MAQKTNLNVAPYFDDFDKDDNFVKTLFRPGFAIQARELTALQSQLQDQITQHGNHVFKEGAMVIPGQINLFPYYSLKLASTFAGETIDPSQYYNATEPVIITGVTSGVKARVIGFAAGTTTDQPLLYVDAIQQGNANSAIEHNTEAGGKTSLFIDGEDITANVGITHTTAYSIDDVSANAYTSPINVLTATFEQRSGPTGRATRRGLAVRVNEGVYYIRGNFVKCEEEVLVLDSYKTAVSALVGFEVTETLITPEDDTSLLDNSTGSSNFAAKGAHRLKISLSLKMLDRDTVNTSNEATNFVQLLDLINGRIRNVVDRTEYAELERNLARRTFEESGSYTVKPFQFKMYESVTVNENEGIYDVGDATDQNNTANSSLLTLQVSPAKAFLRGFELEKYTHSFIDVDKARDFGTFNAGITTAELGNFVNITNIYGSPDVTEISNENTAFKRVDLYDTATSTRGSAAGTHIGVARARGMEYSSGTVGASSTNVESIYKLYLFDVRPFTFLTLSGTPSPTLISNHSNGGVQITGSTSGATGFVFATGTATTKVVLTNVVGNFSSGETITASDSAETDSIVEDSGNADLTISKIETFTFADTKQVFMDDDDSGEDFTADIVTESEQAAERILLEESASRIEGNIISEDEDDVTIERLFSAKIKQPEKNALLYKLPKKVVKTLLTTSNAGVSDTQYTVRRQFVGTTTSNAVSFNAGAGETFVSHAEKDYTLSVLVDGGGASQGDIVSVASTISGTGTSTITITDSTNLPTGTKVKLIATMLKTAAVQKNKTVKLMKKLAVNPGASDAYGTRPTDKTISLGRADVFKLVAVFDSENTSTDVTIPSLTLGTTTGTFTRGEQITGSSSGAKARIINISSPMEYILEGTIDFTTSDTITGVSSSATATVTALTTGSINVVNNFTLDSGMRDNFYDIARIVRKQNAVAPTGKVIVVYDYMEHGDGDVLTVDSYTDVADQMTYDDIPTYTATKVDPDTPEPTGAFPLYDTYDFRPRVEDIAGTSATITATDEITGNSFDFFSRQYDGTGASNSDIPKPDSFIQSDFEYYLPYKANVELTEHAAIIIVKGTAAENPVTPRPHDSNMKLATLTIPAYTFSPDEVEIVRVRHQRFTMKDIGNIEKRVQNVEYYTSLNLLERSAQDLEVTDAAGLNRFKSGFVVDNYAGHRTGDVANPDYKCSIDPEHNELRPKHKMQNIKLIEAATTDAARTDAHYQKTGDVLTLPYEEVTLYENLIATRVERVSAFMRGNWKGHLELDPYGDDWFEPEVRPTITTSVAHDFDFAAALPDNVLGAIWNSWQSQWYGVVEVTQPGEEFANNKFVRSVEARQPKSKVSTEAIANLERVGDDYRVVTQGTRPYIRAQEITYIAKNLKPNTIHYPFFDGRNVAKFVTPAEIRTDSVGYVTGVFSLPDPSTAGNPKFPTGEIEFRLTSSPTNSGRGSNEIDPISVAYAIYYATGAFAQTQAVYLATRPPPPPPRQARVRRSYNGEDNYNNGLDAGEAEADFGEVGEEGTGVGSAGGPGTAGGAGAGGGGGAKIICTALHQMGLLPYDIFAADQEYGRQLAITHPNIIKGYHAWAQVVVEWMNGKDPEGIKPVMWWIEDDKERLKRQANWAIKWAQAIATPWAIQMAHEMGIREKGSKLGKMLMCVGYPISEFVAKKGKINTYGMIALFALLRFMVIFGEKHEFKDNMIAEKK